MTQRRNKETETMTTTKKTARTDRHRPSAIRPEEYAVVMTYALATTVDGWPVPSMGINCELDGRYTDETGRTVNGSHREDGLCCVVGLQASKEKVLGGPGRCTVCGTHHVYGDVWVHEPTAEHIFVGWICADKYQLHADHADFERRHGQLKARSVREREAEMKRQARDAFLAEHPGLASAFETDHDIVQDIRDRFNRFGSISDKQVALVHKIAREVAERANKPAEVHVPAPVADGRQTVEGRVVSVKFHDNAYGGAYKMTVKVETPEGTWLAWGTLPTALEDAAALPSGLKGATVRFDARLKRGRDAHFALFSRPTKAAVVAPAGEAAAA